MIQIITLFFNGMAASPDVRDYRRAVEPLLIKHNARRISWAKVLNSHIGEPDEIHIVRFETSNDFAAFQADPEYQALQDLRNSAMLGTITYLTEEYVTFLD